MDEKIVLKRLKKLIEINKFLLELKRAYIKAINPEVSKFLRSKGYKFSLIGGVAYSIVFEPRATFFHREKLMF